MSRGGYREGAGRKPGSLNEKTIALQALAETHAETMIAELARLAFHSKSEAIRIAAIREMFNRGFGSAAPLPLEPVDDIPQVQVLRWATDRKNAEPDPADRNADPDDRD